MHKSTLIQILGLIGILILISACGGEKPTSTPLPTTAVTTPQPATSTPTTQASQNPTVVAAATNPPATAAASQPPAADPTAASDGAIPSGITADGFYYLGNPDAQVTLTDYSDFL